MYKKFCFNFHLVNPGKCEILRDEIETYDKKTLELPETDCEVVLAKDCSSYNHPSFMVTLKKERKEDTKKVNLPGYIFVYFFFLLLDGEQNIAITF